jgi:16S rRNA processing protein RimM
LDQAVEHAEALAAGSKVIVSPPGVEFLIEESWFHQGRPVLKFAGIDSIEEAEKLRNAEVAVLRSSLGEAPLLGELTGCEVWEGGRRLGEVAGWHETGAAPVIELDTGLLIPFAAEFFPGIDMSARRIEVKLPEGLEDL